MSPHPWGSHAAEGFRKSDSLDRIAFAVFNNASKVNFSARSAFSAGSHVLWTPVYVRPDGQIKYTKPISAADGWTEAWLASRLPPYRTANGTSELEIDVTSLIIDKQSLADPIEILYDNRFTLSFYPRAIPAEVLGRLCAHPSSGQRLLVTATKKHVLPCLAFRQPNGDAVEDAAIGGPGFNRYVLPMINTFGNSGTFTGAGWVDWRLIRSFE